MEHRIVVFVNMAKATSRLARVFEEVPIFAKFYPLGRGMNACTALTNPGFL
jgi:hypothetical protein